MAAIVFYISAMAAGIFLTIAPANSVLVMRRMRAVIKPDGTWLIADVHGGESFEQNLTNPIAPFFYSISVLCCMSSALSEPRGSRFGNAGISRAGGAQDDRRSWVYACAPFLCDDRRRPDSAYARKAGWRVRRL